MKNALILSSFLFALCVSAFAQEMPPTPGTPRSAAVPAVQEKKLPNGLTVAVVERKAVPLVTIQLLIKSGASSENADEAGLADMTATLLTKGTKTKTATQIAEEVEFLGGSINSGAGWNSSFVSLTVTSDKVEQALAILADVVLNPKFEEKELELLKSQTLDELTYNLKQPSFLANYVASKYSFGEHPAGGTPASVGDITRPDIVKFHSKNFKANHSVLIFTGDITITRASFLATKMLGGWRKTTGWGDPREDSAKPTGGRFLIIDLPKSGQASVTYAKPVSGTGRISDAYFPALVMNTVLGGGYSSRLNYEIRIKRGLSYGAGSSIGWRSGNSNFATRTQTKNESAAEVVELVLAEVKRLSDTSVASDELVPRKSVLTGSFGRNLETTGGLASAVGDLYAFGIPTSELNSYVSNVNDVTDAQIKDFAARAILGGDIIIVGDYSIFKDDLAKRFPGTKVNVVKADELDLSKDNLRK